MGTSLIAQLVKNPPAMQETLVWFLGWEDPLKKGKSTHSSVLDWRIPWTVESSQFSSVSQLGPTLCNTMDYSTPSFPVHHQLLELTQIHCHRVSDAIQPYILCCPLLLLPFPATGSLQMSQFFTSGGQSIGISAPVSHILMNIRDRFPLGLTGWISCSPRESQESSPTPQFKNINSSALSFL